MAPQVAILTALVLLLASCADAVQKITTMGMGPWHMQNFTDNSLYFARGKSSYVTQIHQILTNNTYEGQEAFINGTYPWVISDMPLRPDLAAKAQAMGKGISTIPLFYNYISFFHNVTNWYADWDFDAYPRFGPDLIADIITGKVRYWNQTQMYNDGNWGSSTIMKWLTPADATINFVGLKGSHAANYWLSKWLDQNKNGSSPDINYRGDATTRYAYTQPYDWPYGVTDEIPWPAHINLVSNGWDAANFINTTANSLGFFDSFYGLNYSDARGWGVQWWDGLPIQLYECEILNRDGNNLTSQQNTFDVQSSYPQWRRVYTIPSTLNFTAMDLYTKGQTSRPGWKSYPLTYMVNAYTWSNLTSYGAEGAMIKQWLSFWQTDRARSMVKKYYFRVLQDNMRNNSIWGTNNITVMKPEPFVWQEDSLVDTFIY